MANSPKNLAEALREISRIRREMKHMRGAQAAQSDKALKDLTEYVNQHAGGGDARIPAAPVELTTETSIYFDGNGRPRGQFRVAFPPVTKATDASALIVDSYEVWGYNVGKYNPGPDPENPAIPDWALLASSNVNALTVTNLDPKTTWRYRVRAQGKTTTIPGAWSEEIVTYIAPDTTPPPLPSKPILTQTLGTVAVEWDGFTATGVNMPTDFHHVEIAVGENAEPTTLISDRLLAGGTVIVAGLEYDVPYRVRFRAVDTSDNVSGWSAVSEITVKALVPEDFPGLDVTIEEKVREQQRLTAEARDAAFAAAAQAKVAAEAQAKADSLLSNANTLHQVYLDAKAAADAAQAASVAAAANLERIRAELASLRDELVDEQRATALAWSDLTAALPFVGYVYVQHGSVGAFTTGDVLFNVDAKEASWLKADGTWEQITAEPWTGLQAEAKALLADLDAKDAAWRAKIGQAESILAPLRAARAAVSWKIAQFRAQVKAVVGRSGRVVPWSSTSAPTEVPTVGTRQVVGVMFGAAMPRNEVYPDLYVSSVEPGGWYWNWESGAWEKITSPTLITALRTVSDAAAALNSAASTADAARANVSTTYTALSDAVGAAYLAEDRLRDATSEREAANTALVRADVVLTQAKADSAAALAVLQAALPAGGKVIYQDATPAAADQDEKNVWVKTNAEVLGWYVGSQAWQAVADGPVKTAGVEYAGARNGQAAAQSARDAANATLTQKTTAYNTRVQENQAAIVAVSTTRKAYSDAQVALVAAEAAYTASSDAYVLTYDDANGFVQDNGEIFVQDTEPTATPGAPLSIWAKHDGTTRKWDAATEAWVPYAGDQTFTALLTAYLTHSARLEALPGEIEAKDAERANASAEADRLASEASRLASVATAALVDWNLALQAAEAQQVVADREKAEAVRLQGIADEKAAAAGYVDANDVIGRMNAEEALKRAQEALDAALAAAQAAEIAAKNAANVLPNPSFEADFSGWAPYQGYGGSAVITTAISKDGSKAVDVLQALQRVSVEIPVTDDTIWELAIWVRSTMSNVASPGFIALLDTPTSAPTSDLLVAIPSTLEAGVWTQVKQRVTIPKGKTTLHLLISGSGSGAGVPGALVFDSVSMRDVTQVVALEAATKAAQDAAKAAQDAADKAAAEAGDAAQIAQDAVKAATHAGNNFFSPALPTGAAPFGSIWFQIDDTGMVISQWQQTGGRLPDPTTGDVGANGSTWTKREITSQVISNLDVGKLTGGYIDAAHIEGDTILVGDRPLGEIGQSVTDWAMKSNATYIDGGKIYTGTITALQIKANSLTADTLAVGAVEAKHIKAGAITSDKISATAINGKIIEGATVWSGADYNTDGGYKISNYGLEVWAPGGTQTFLARASDGKVTVKGDIVSGSTIKGASIEGGSILMSGNSRTVKIGATSSAGYIDFDGPTATSPATLQYSEEDYLGTGTKLRPKLRFLTPSVTGTWNARSYFEIGPGITNGSSITEAQQNPSLDLPANMEIRFLGSGAINTAGNKNLYYFGQDFYVSTGINFSLIKTSSGSANLLIGSTGWIAKTGSARKLKLDIQDVPQEWGDKILDVPARTWFDRGEMQRAASKRVAERAGDDILDERRREVLSEFDAPSTLRRIPGVVAEEVEEAGLSEFVTYEDDGEVQGVMYDRLWVALIPAVRALRDRVEHLEQALAQMNA